MNIIFQNNEELGGGRGILGQPPGY